MKHILSLFKPILFLFLLSHSALGQNHNTTEKEKIDYRKIGAPMPELRIVDRAGLSYSALDFTEDKNAFLILFNPTCGHCLDLAQLIMKNKTSFEDNTVMMMAAAEMMSFLPQFAGEANWEDGANFILGVDSAHVVEELFNYQILPQINIYDKNHKLIKSLYGDVSMPELEGYLK